MGLEQHRRSTISTLNLINWAQQPLLQRQDAVYIYFSKTTANLPCDYDYEKRVHACHREGSHSRCLMQPTDIKFLLQHAISKKDRYFLSNSLEASVRVPFSLRMQKDSDLQLCHAKPWLKSISATAAIERHQVWFWYGLVMKICQSYRRNI